MNIEDLKYRKNKQIKKNIDYSFECEIVQDTDGRKIDVYNFSGTSLGFLNLIYNFLEIALEYELFDFDSYDKLTDLFLEHETYLNKITDYENNFREFQKTLLEKEE